jgi:hypothetical protein
MRGIPRLLAAGIACLAGAFALPSRADDAAEPPPETPAVSPKIGDRAEAKAVEPSGGSSGSAASSSGSEVWYGGPIIAIDAVSLLMMPFAALGAGSESGAAGFAFVAAGYGGFLAGGPIVHAANHAEAAVVGGDFLLRLIVPPLTTLAGVELASSSVAQCETHDGEFCGLGSAFAGVLGFYVGAIAVSAIDAAALSRKPANGAPAPPDKRASSFQLTPLVDVRHEQGRSIPTLGVAGTF